MSRQISQEETQKLFWFCQEKGIEHYDLQIELVDHLASYIEEQWETQPDVPFKNFLQVSFKKFGIYGFSKIKKEKEKELKTKYSRLHREFILQFFKLPKVILTLLLTLLLFSVFKIYGDYITIYILYISAFTILMGYFFIWYSPRVLKLKAVNNTKFILLDYYKKTKNIFPILALLPINIINVFNFDILPVNPLNNTIPEGIWGNVILLTLAFILVIIGVAVYSSAFYIPLKIKEYFIKHYPEFVKK